MESLNVTECSPNHRVKSPLSLAKENMSLLIDQYAAGLQAASTMGVSPYLTSMKVAVEEVVGASTNDAVLASFVSGLEKITKDQDFPLKPKIINEFAQLLGEAHFYTLCKDRGVQLRRVKEESEQRPDFSLAEQDVFFEVKTLSVVTGNLEINRSIIESHNAKISIENQLHKGARIAFGESEAMPYENKPHKMGPVSAVIDTLLEKIRQNFKPGQYRLGPTFLVVNLSMIQPFRTESLILRPAYCDNYLFHKSVSGDLWFVAFGRPGAPILGIPEFEGMKCIESTMNKLGILVDDEYSFLKGMLFIVHPLRRPAEIWGLERHGLAEELASSHPELMGVLRKLTGSNWNDDVDRNGWRLNGEGTTDD